MSLPEQRERVVEHRVTSKWGHLLIRWWIEADPAHGGIAAATDAYRMAKAAEEELAAASLDEVEIAALKLLTALPAANSVEICDERTGMGTAVHRDWP